MKPRLLAVLAALPLAAVPALRAAPQGPGAPARQDAPQASLEERVAALENELAAERRRHDETRALLERTLGYLAEQAQAAEKLLVALTEAEQQGFAVGENWRARETLLAGWRAYWGAKAANLPAAPKPQAAPPKAIVSPRAARQ